MTKELIEEFRRIVIPYMVNRFKEINYEGQGGSDAEEFKSNFNEICDLAIKALEQEPTTKNDLGVENDLVSSIVKKISEKVTETREEFIFETIRPYCENVVQMKISKRDLEQALLKLEQEPVLDKIRAEIEPTRKMYFDMNDIDWVNGCDYVLSVIDKYKAESEET